MPVMSDGSRVCLELFLKAPPENLAKFLEWAGFSLNISWTFHLPKVEFDGVFSGWNLTSKAVVPPGSTLSTGTQRWRCLAVAWCPFQALDWEVCMVWCSACHGDWPRPRGWGYKPFVAGMTVPKGVTRDTS